MAVHKTCKHINRVRIKKNWKVRVQDFEAANEDVKPQKEVSQRLRKSLFMKEKSRMNLKYQLLRKK